MISAIVGIKKLLTKMLEWLVILAMLTLVLDVLYGVLARYVLNRPAIIGWLGDMFSQPVIQFIKGGWTEELARILLIWTGLLGASVAYAEKAHLGVDYLVQKLSPGVMQMVTILVHALVGFFAVAVLLVGGYNLMAETFRFEQMMQAVGILKGYVYLALPISGAFFTIFSIEFILEAIVNKQQFAQSEHPLDDVGEAVEYGEGA